MTLVVALGGVRSGKSAWAERQAQELAGDGPVTVLATADPADRSMQDRIERHRARRDATWSTVEILARDDLAAALPERGVALLDGLGGWVAAVLDRAGAFVDDAGRARAARQRAADIVHAEVVRLLDAVAGDGRALVVATEEAGLGVVPLGAGTAAWVDLLGELNQRLVQAADLAVVVVAGRALPLTDAAEPLTRPEPSPSLTVIASDDEDEGVAEDRERRAHPRLLGAGAIRPVAAPGATDVNGAAGSPSPRTSGVSTMAPPVPAPAETETTTAPPETADPADQDVVDLAALRRHGDRLVRPGDADHAVNVVAEGPPAWLTDAFAQALTSGLTSYPDPTEAEATLAGLYGRSPGEVVVTNGAAQALWLLPAALRPQRAAVFHPLFTEAEAALHAHGVPVTRVFRDQHADFELDPSDVPDSADLVLVSNPAAASGTLAPRSAILGLRQPGRTIVVDEAFMDLVPGEAESMLGIDVPDVIVVRSFTKSLSIPGVRAGAAIAPAPLAARLRAVQPPWSVNAFALAGLTALGRHPGELVGRARRAVDERADLAGRLASLAGVRVWASATNHLLVEIAGGARIAAALRERRIAVRPCGTFPGLTDDHLRLTARAPEANAALVAALGDVLDLLARR